MFEHAPYQRPRYETLGGVALHVANEAATDLKAWRRDLRYSPAAAIEVVCHQRRSIASCGQSPSFLWAHLVLDEDSVPVPEIDLGAMTHLARIAGPKLARRMSWPSEKMAEGGAWDVVAPGLVYSSLDRTSEHDWPLRMGIALGQRFLIEARGNTWRCSHEEEEYDSSWDTSILYLDPPPSVTYVPVHSPCRK